MQKRKQHREELLKRIKELYGETAVKLKNSCNIRLMQRKLKATLQELNVHKKEFHRVEFYLSASKKQIRPEQARRQSKTNFTGRILFMDDEEILRNLSIKLLGRMGFKVITAVDGSEALKLFEDAINEKRPFDAVIVDLTVPGGMGGKEAIQKLRKLDPKIKAVVSSGYSNDPVMADCKKYGFNDVISKPFQVHELGQVLKKLIN